jgi:hypothetical protein
LLLSVIRANNPEREGTASPRHLSGIPLSLDYLDRYMSTSDRDRIVDGGRGWFLSVD